MEQEIKKIRGKYFKCTKVTADDKIELQLLSFSEEYESLMNAIFELDTNISKQDRELKEIEFRAEYDLINTKQEKKPTIAEREMMLKQSLKENQLHSDLIIAKLNNQNELKLKRSRLDIVTFQTGIYKRILEYRSNIRNGEQI
jgi:hypothetical protein